MTQKRRIPRLLQLALIILGVYLSFILVFDVMLGQLIPKSLLTMYMVFVIAGVLMTFTFTEEGTQELVGPIKALVEDPSRKMIRNVVFVIVPLLAGYYTYSSMMPPTYGEQLKAKELEMLVNYLAGLK